MDPIIRAIRDLARQLANDRQAISLSTAHNLVTEVAHSAGFKALPSNITDSLAHELCALIEENWFGDETQGDVSS